MTKLLTASCVLAAFALTGCAANPEPRWPMVPKRHKMQPFEVHSAANIPPLPSNVSLPAPPEEPSAPDYADIFDRIRAGYGMPDIEHAAIDQQLRFFVSMPGYLDRAFARSERYLYYVVHELESRGMPLELVMLPVVESAYNPYAYSRARAAGIWQFIAPTAVRYQVRVNWWQDGRRDIVDSTRAALDYLQTLHGMFDGDWLRAMAAYNCGENCVARAIERNRAAGLPTDFFSLRLPAETRAYVPKLLALSRLVGNPGDYGLEFREMPNEPYFARVEVPGQIDLRVAAVLAGVTEDEMHALNPAFNRWATDPDGPHHLLVPLDSAAEFARAVQELTPAQRMPLERYVVRPGDSVTSLARTRDVPVSTIRRLNGVEAATLRVGDEILLPARHVSTQPLRAGLVIEGETAPPAVRRTGQQTYVVRSGDTLSGIARRHGVQVRDLARWNGIAADSTLRVGQRLAVRSGSAGSAQRTAQAAPASTRAPAAPANQRRLSYTVRSGDTLYQISKRFQVSIAQLREWNRLPNSNLRPGQRLVVYVDGRDFGG